MQRISINNLCNPKPEPSNQRDEEIAAEALDSLRNSNDLNNSHSSNEIHQNDHFLNRVSNLPLVNSALRAYESTKANSFVVKYGAETVESSVKSICMPVINKLEPQLGQLDDFACRQLDKLEKHYSSFMDSSTQPQLNEHNQQNGHYPVHSSVHQPYPKFEDGSELRNRRVMELSGGGPACQPSYTPQSNEIAKPAPRSRWQQVVLEAGVTASAGVALVSEESMKCLRYCQQWLAYASAHIEQQIQLLRNYLVSLATPSNSTALSTRASTAAFLSNIKKEVVATLRKVIDVVGRYAGSCLPGDARNSVRNFILNLPGRWASLNMPYLESDISTPCSSPLLTPNSSCQNSPSLLTPTEQTNRVLTLATESMNMLHNVGGIFKESVERAEGWLRAVGRSPNHTSYFPENAPMPQFSLLPPPVSRPNQNFGSSNSYSNNDHQCNSYNNIEIEEHARHESLPDIE
ncbi:Opi1-domain-containing protein [Neoconidiobolus thromboides FSU 785]|nr:Opi1-domain-containing protein [Neoconidiobolus thromboides FSU 785]